MDATVAKERVEAIVKNGANDNDGQRVEVGDDIVGDTLDVHLSTLETSSAANAVIVPELDGEEAEHASGLERALDILDELVVPAGLSGETVSSTIRGLRRLPPSLAANAQNAAAREAVAEDLEDVGEIGTAGLVDNNAGLEPEEQERQGNVEDEGKEESQPPANILGRVRGGSGHEGTDVDEEVEPQHDTLGGVLGVLDDALARLEGDDHGHVALHLIKQERSDVGLEHGCGSKVSTAASRSVHLS